MTKLTILSLKTTCVRFLVIGIIVSIHACLFPGKGIAQVVINEFFPMGQGKWPDWIELYNHGSSSHDLGGYFLSDRLDGRRKWEIPKGTFLGPGKYLLFIADKKNIQLHTNFRLNSRGDAVGLYDPQGRLLDGIEFGPQLKAGSIGRFPNGNGDWFHFSNPTPQAANTSPSSPFVTENPEADAIASPSFSLPEGKYAHEIKVSLSCHPQALTTFTVDGSEPSMTSKPYANPLLIRSTTVLKARAFKDNRPMSPVVVRTYFIGESSTLPMVSLSVNPVYLWDETYGIYVEGSKWKRLNWNKDYYNYKQNWKRTAHLELFNTSGIRRINSPVQIRISGHHSRLKPQKSILVEFLNPTGIQYRLFSQKELSKFNSIVLRNSGQDWGQTMFRDAFIQDLVSETTDIDYQAYQPSVVYINGMYWGIHNLRERIDRWYLGQNHEIDPKKIDLLENDQQVISGDNKQYRLFLDKLNSLDLKRPQNFALIQTMMDVDEFTDYQVAEIFCNNLDWPQNNVRYWRPRVEGGKWRWILYDVDHGFMRDRKQSSISNNTLNKALGINSQKPWTTLVFRRLMTNDEYRRFFIQRFFSHLNTTFQTRRVIDKINSFQSFLQPEMPRHIERWGSPISMEKWNREVEMLRTFAKERPRYVKKHLQGVFNLADFVRINVESGSNGMVFLEGVPINGPEFIGDYPKGLPLQVRAEAQPGYRFKKWEGSIQSPNNTVTIVPATEFYIRAVWGKIAP